MQCAENRSKVRVVAGDRQYDSTELRQWTKEVFKAETAIPTIKGKDDKKRGRGTRVDSKFRVTGPKRLVKAYHGRFCAERVFKKLKGARHAHILNLDISQWLV